MKTADLFKVQNNIELAFESRGCEYRMHLLIENGLIRLENKTNGGDTILFLGEIKGYTGESVGKATEVQEKPKKKRKKKSK